MAGILADSYEKQDLGDALSAGAVAGAAVQHPRLSDDEGTLKQTAMIPEVSGVWQFEGRPDLMHEHCFVHVLALVALGAQTGTPASRLMPTMN